ncbi:hypothetical protein CDL60_00575 [Roseateles noduli]|nr:hypothetical protein CDL60_00575 [Roseateles noduli]
MNAVLERIDFSPYMTTLDTLTIRIDSELMRQLKARAADAHFSVDELVEQMIRASLFRHSPEYFDPTSERAQHFRMVEEGLREVILGETVPLDEAMEAIRKQLGATKPSGSSSKR